MQAPDEELKIKEYQNAYPHSLAFHKPNISNNPHQPTYNINTSLREMALEFHLEQVLSQCNQLLSEKTYVSEDDFVAGNFSAVADSTPKHIAID